MPNYIISLKKMYNTNAQPLKHFQKMYQNINRYTAQFKLHFSVRNSLKKKKTAFKNYEQKVSCLLHNQQQQKK